jgi:DNA-binding transcriptional regulator YdaS (Cro superfamily)
MPISPLEKAIEIVGSQTALASACGVKQAYIWNWINRDKRVPAEYVIPACRATGFEVTPHQMRPDIYPNKTDGMPPGKPRARTGKSGPPPEARHANQFKAA